MSRPARLWCGRRTARAWAPAALAALTLTSASPQRLSAETPAVAGWVETVCLQTPAVCLEAKLDTGAATSSLGASNITAFSRDGQAWVRFTLTTDSAEPLQIEAPVARRARIRRAGTEVSKRPVIALDICLMGRAGKAEFTLTDRSGMKYPALIGRAFLSGKFHIDPARTLTGAGLCVGPSTR